MLQSIQINHFRCFTDLHVDGLSRFNLIGGGNNSGKTALLEALLINHIPHSTSLKCMQKIRLETNDIKKSRTDEVWDSLFFNLDSNKNIEITSILKNNYYKINIQKENLSNSLDFLSLDDELQNDMKDKITEDFLNFIGNQKKLRKISIYQSQKNKEKKIAVEALSQHKGAIYKDINKTNDFIPLVFVQSNKNNLDPVFLAQRFDQIFNDGLYPIILHAVQIIDPSIFSMRTNSANGVPILTASRDDKLFLPIGLFGDAFTMIIALFFDIITLSSSSKNQSSILLIDEIENGIHHNNHYKVLEYIYKLSKEYNIQIFATTHSIEMIEAFSQLALDQNELKTDFNYIEMAKNRKNKIIAISIEPEIIQYKIENNWPFRGEHR